MQRPTAVISPYGSVSDTIDMKPIRTPTTRQGNGWLLKRGFEDSSLFLSPELMRDSHGPFTVGYNSSKPKVVQTPVGPAFEIVEATTNYILNPRFEGVITVTGSTAWDRTLNGDKYAISWGTGYNGGVPNPEIGYHAHLVEGAGPNGENCLRFIDMNSQFGMAHRWLGTTSSLDFTDSGIVEGSTLTISFDMKTTDIGKPVRPGLYGYKKGTNTRSFEGTQEYLYCTKPDVWERVSYTTQIPDTFDIARPITLYIYGHYINIEAITMVTNVQLEQKEYVSAFCCGSEGGPDSWTGSPYVSPSTRKVTDMSWLVGDTLRATEGTMALKNIFKQPARNNYLYFSSGTGRKFPYASRSRTSGRIHTQFPGSGSLATSFVPPDTEQNYVITWEGRTYKVFLNGVYQFTKEDTVDMVLPSYMVTAYNPEMGWTQTLNWVKFKDKLSDEAALRLSGKMGPWDYYETSRFDLQYLTQPATVLVFYRTSPEMPVQSARFSESGDIGGVGYIDMHSTGLSVRTYDRMILDSVVLFNENLSTQDEQDFVKIPPAYQNHLVETTRTGRVVQGYGDKQLLVNELPKSLTGNRYYQLLVSSV